VCFFHLWCYCCCCFFFFFFFFPQNVSLHLCLIWWNHIIIKLFHESWNQCFEKMSSLRWWSCWLIASMLQLLQVHVRLSIKQSQNPLDWDHEFVIVDTIGCLPCVCNYCNITNSSPRYMCVGCCFPIQVVMIPKRRLKGTWSIMSPQCDHMDLVRPMISFLLWRLSVNKLFHCHGFLFMTMAVYLCLKHFQFP
jgi:hypothetical protein